MIYAYIHISSYIHAWMGIKCHLKMLEMLGFPPPASPGARSKLIDVCSHRVLGLQEFRGKEDGLIRPIIFIHIPA
jgi:hypothetical protein